MLGRLRLTAYLEANDPRSRYLYQRLVYASHEPIQFPDGGPPIWPMTRPAEHFV